MTGADSQRRRRGIFVETQPNQSPAPSGAAYSGSLVERFENVVLPGKAWDFSWGQLKAAAVEPHGGLEALAVAIAEGAFDQALDFVVETFDRPVG